jgi:two-component system nitrate/nitrite response regulator NarL
MTGVGAPGRAGPRVLIADDHAPVRAGVRTALEHDGCTVCAEAATADEAVEAAIRERPAVCLVDVRMPGNGIGAVARITAALPDTVVVMLTVSDRSGDLFDALGAGAVGYLLKDMDPVGLAPAVRAAARGEAPIAGALTRRLVEEFRRRGRRTTLAVGDGRSVELTPREWDILEALADGLSTNDTARRLSIDVVTVRRHTSTLLRKLGVASRAEAARLLLEP